MSDQPKPVCHLLRDGPPWQATGDVECGANMQTLRSGIAVPWFSRESVVRGVGQFTLEPGHEWCAECRSLVDYVYHGHKPRWADNPAGVIAQHAQGDPASINADLIALAKLVEIHRDEFEVIRWADSHGRRLT